jgi:hypothetical protein
MKKSNIIVLMVALIACAFLLWLWGYLGFNLIDESDPFYALSWALLIVIAVVGISWAESARRKKMRLAFVGNGKIYNPEVGLVSTTKGCEVQSLKQILENLNYPIEIKKISDIQSTSFDWIIRSTKFDAQNGIWEGDVRFASQSNAVPQPFKNQHELLRLVGME